MTGQFNDLSAFERHCAQRDVLNEAKQSGDAFPDLDPVAARKLYMFLETRAPMNPGRFKTKEEFDAWSARRELVHELQQKLAPKVFPQ